MGVSRKRGPGKHQQILPACIFKDQLSRVCMCMYLLLEELASSCCCPHGAAMQSVCQHPPPVFVSTHTVLTPDGQSLLPGHIDQRHTHHLLAHLPQLAAQA